MPYGQVGAVIPAFDAVRTTRETFPSPLVQFDSHIGMTCAGEDFALQFSSGTLDERLDIVRSRVVFERLLVHRYCFQFQSVFHIEIA